MSRKDTLRLFDLELAREIVRMDRDELLRFVETREERLRGMPAKQSVFVFSNDRVSTRTTAMVFNEFFDDDPDEVRQMLINDLCYLNEPFEVDYYARCGYLDHPSSLYEGCGEGRAICSLDLLPWPEDSEAGYWAGRFDVIDRDHIGLMTDALRQNREKLSVEDYTRQLLTLRSLEKTLDIDPNLRAAYFYR